MKLRAVSIIGPTMTIIFKESHIFILDKADVSSCSDFHIATDGGSAGGDDDDNGDDDDDDDGDVVVEDDDDDDDDNDDDNEDDEDDSIWKAHSLVSKSKGSCTCGECLQFRNITFTSQ